MIFQRICISLIVLLSLVSGKLFSQHTSYFHVDAGLTQTYKGFFYLFDGIVDVGAGYNHHLVKGLFAGPSLHLDFLNRKNTSGRTLVYKPKVNILYEFQITNRFGIVPVASVGYSFLNISNKEFGYKETQQGINLSGDLRLIWKTNDRLDFYIFGRYDYIFLDKDESFTRLDYYRNVYLTSFGIGIKIKPKEHES